MYSGDWGGTLKDIAAAHKSSFKWLAHRCEVGAKRGLDCQYSPLGSIVISLSKLRDASNHERGVV